ncbi:hypothetical protein nACB1_003 [Acinetobacter phage nACB1]|nr:hypothetical protein nACB1_003 [Acinetobacter phage nACB1]
MLTKDEIIQALPPSVQGGVSDTLVNDLNSIITDPDFRETFRENMISYNRVLAEGKFKLSSYMNAVMYVSYKLMGYNNMDAYSLTFPQKFQSWVVSGKTNQTMSAHVAMYNKSKLVNLVYAQAVIPTHVLNQDKFQEAINRQYWLMNNAASEKVQSDAANSLMIHLKPPEEKQINLNIGMEETDTIKELYAAIGSLAAKQVQAIADKTFTAGEIAASRIIEAEVIDV